MRMNTHILRVELLDSPRGRRISAIREIEIRGNSSLYDLAEAIVRAYGFDFDHAFGFFSRMGDDHFRSERKYELFADMEDTAGDHPDSGSVKHTESAAVWKTLGDRMLFLFDYGDTWRFTVQLVGFGVAGSKNARVLKSQDKAPEQYPAVAEDGEE